VERIELGKKGGQFDDFPDDPKLASFAEAIANSLRPGVKQSLQSRTQPIAAGSTIATHCSQIVFEWILSVAAIRQNGLRERMLARKRIQSDLDHDDSERRRSRTHSFLPVHDAATQTESTP
jgi:hypothetical protein